ncbi:MAG: DUF3108 domain-containing protein [Deltaproteobacteria bacterium]|nr:DUF3108 domain-containing protein [Deltaproteobacteria bacterium]
MIRLSDKMPRPIQKLLFTLWRAAAVILVVSAVHAQEPGTKIPPTMPVYQPKFYPYESGETALYKATWNGIPVATAEVHATPVTIEGKKFFRVRVDAKTSKGLDLIWKMRDTITSVFDGKSLAPSRFVFSQRENSRVIDTEALFDNTTKKWTINRWQKGKKPRVFVLDSNNTLDPITAVYLARSIDLNVGEKLLFDVFGGRHRYLLELAVEKKEPVTLESGAIVEAFKVVPKLTNLTKKGYASRMNEAAIWISADERRIPVKLWSKIFVGNVYLELVRDQAGIQSAAKAMSFGPAS